MSSSDSAIARVVVSTDRRASRTKISTTSGSTDGTQRVMVTPSGGRASRPLLLEGTERVAGGPEGGAHQHQVFHQDALPFGRQVGRGEEKAQGDQERDRRAQAPDDRQLPVADGSIDLFAFSPPFNVRKQYGLDARGHAVDDALPYDEYLELARRISIG
jgi:hypothetical protein